MECVVVKSGLANFDTARAYGLAQLLQIVAAGKATPRVLDRGGIFALTLAAKPNAAALKGSDVWRAVLAENNWQRVFLTYKRAWPNQRDKVRKTLESRVEDVLAKATSDGLPVSFDGGFALPGPLEPAGFKGLKGLTGGSYSEGQTTVDELNWALACLGGVIAQRYKIQKATGKKWEYYVTLPVPEEVRFGDFHGIRQLVYDKGLSYNGVRNAAAHFAVLLADAVRHNAAGNPQFPARFSNVLYFSLFQSGQQFKPSVGGSADVHWLIQIGLEKPVIAKELFTTWDYLFRRGSTLGSEDIAQAITELALAPSLDTYYRHARIFNRYVVDSTKRLKPEYLYDETALKEVLNYAEQ